MMNEHSTQAVETSLELERGAVTASGPGPLRSRNYSGDGARESAEESSHNGLLEYLRVLRRRKGTVILIAFLGFLAGVLITLPQTPVYQARASLEIQDINQNFLNIKDMSPVNDAGSYAALTDIQTQIKILQSETLIDRTAQKLRSGALSDLRVETGRIPAWRKALNLPGPSGADQRESSLRAAAGNLKVRAAGQTRIIELMFDSTNPTVAAAFLNTLSNEFIDQNMEAHWQMAQRTGDWLGRQLDDMRIRLERSEDALQAYARKAGLLFTGEKENVSEDKLRQLQASLSAAQAERAARQSKWEIARIATPETLAEVLSNQILQADQSKLTDLRRELAELSATYKPEYSKVRRIQAQIAEMDQALTRERKSILEGLRNEYDAAQRHEALLAVDYDAQVRLVTADGEKSIQYNILKREVDSNRQLYETVLQKVKESSITSAMRASNIRVVDAAKPPLSPYKPRLSTNAALGLLAGLFLGIGFVVIREREDRALQEPGEIPFWLNVPELGVIPSSVVAGRGLAYFSSRRHKNEEPNLAALVPSKPEADKGEECIELVTWQRQPSMQAEAFRVVLTSLLFSGNNGSRPRVLVMTSATPMEGKTTVTSNLGIALAEIKQKVLIIDADLRKPRMHAIFGVSNDRGLSTLLSQRPLPAGSLDGIIQETKISGLFLLPSGPATQAAASLLYSANLPELLARFKKEFDIVILDTPPMLLMPDARVVGRNADGVVLVFRAGQTTRDAAIAARQRFAEDETRVVGAILNGWNPKREPNAYYGYSNGNAYYTGYSRNHYDGDAN